MPKVSADGRRVAVVGAGIGGLSAAALLAKDGYEVDVYERLPYAGGKAASLDLGGYRFDTGPSLFTMPWVFRDFFARLGERMEERLRPIALEPICNYFYPDGSRLSAYGDEARFGAELEAKTGSTRAELGRYLRSGGRLWDIAGELFLTKSLHETSTYLSKRGLRSIAKLPWIDPFRSLHEANATAFRDPRVVQLFDRYATYNGSSPFKTPATMRIVPQVEYQWGGWAVEGGIRSVATALEGAARDAGARIRLDSEVEAILTEPRGARGREGPMRTPGPAAGGRFEAGRPARATGVRVGGRELPYDIVVSDADVLSTYRRLLGAPDAPEARRYESLEPSSSGLVFLWGIKAAFPELSSNNIFFSGDYRAEFQALFAEPPPARGSAAGAWPGPELTIYINITSKTTPGDAPPGRENWFVLVNAPRNAGQDWAPIAAEVRRRVLERLSRELGRDVEALIEVERITTPADIERDTGSTYGSLYGIASNDRLSAFFRHPNRSRRIRGLYFCGGSAHPGGGMPLALLSGGLAAELARKYGND